MLIWVLSDIPEIFGYYPTYLRYFAKSLFTLLATPLRCNLIFTLSKWSAEIELLIKESVLKC